MRVQTHRITPTKHNVRSIDFDKTKGILRIDSFTYFRLACAGFVLKTTQHICIHVGI